MDDAEEALAYERADFRQVNAKFVHDLLAHVEGREVRRAVDLGCGPADIAARVHEERPEWQIAAIDGAMAMLKLGHKATAASGRVSLILAHAQRLPLADHSVDLVFSNSLLHHLPDPLPFWREIGRIAQPHGYVFVRDLIRPVSEAAARTIVREHAGGESMLLQEEFYRSLLAAFTPQEISFQLAAAGLNRLKVTISSDRHVDVAGVL